MVALPDEVLQACKLCNIRPSTIFQYRIGANDVSLLDIDGHKYRVELERLNTRTIKPHPAEVAAARKAIETIQEELVTLPPDNRSRRNKRRK